MRISDWSSDVCSSDLAVVEEQVMDVAEAAALGGDVVVAKLLDAANHGGSSEGKGFARGQRRLRVRRDRESVELGKSVSVRVDRGGRRHMKEKKNNKL